MHTHSPRRHHPQLGTVLLATVYSQNQKDCSHTMKRQKEAGKQDLCFNYISLRAGTKGIRRCCSQDSHGPSRFLSFPLVFILPLPEPGLRLPT